MLFEKERSKVSTLRANFREAARIFSISGVFDLDWYWLQRAFRSSSGECEPTAPVALGSIPMLPQSKKLGVAWHFVFDENSRTLRLKSKLFDLRAVNANQQRDALGSYP